VTTGAAGGNGSFENIYGGSGDDHLVGNAKENILSGGAGSNILDGGPGNDTALYPSLLDTLISIENLIFRLPLLAVEPIWIRVIPVLSEDTIALNVPVPTILVLLDAEEYERRDEVRLISTSPYPEASMGDQVYFPAGIGEFASLEREMLDTLPGAIPGDVRLVSALTVSVFGGGISLDVIPGRHKLLVSFIIPQELIGRDFVILYWNEALGGWVELETIILYWDTRLDGWAMENTGFVSEGRAVASAGYTGTFVMVERP